MPKLLVIGTCHEYQRWQKDDCPERDQLRREFTDIVSKAVEERHVELIAEEAGNDALVAEHLTKVGYPQGPQEPIAKQVSREYPFCRHVDIRPPGGECMTPQLREQKMFDKIVATVGEATSVLVICGNDHCEALRQRFSGLGFDVESQQFPPL